MQYFFFRVKSYLPMPKTRKNLSTKKIPAKKVILSQDGKNLLFTSITKNKLLIGKKFRQNPELEAFYQFVHENNLRAETCHVLFQLIQERKQKTKTTKNKRASASSRK